MRLLLLCAALGYAHACSTSGATPCDGYIQAQIQVEIIGGDDNCGQSGLVVGETFVDFLGVDSAQVSLEDSDCGSTFTFNFNIYNLDQDQYNDAKDIQVSEADFDSALRGSLSFDEVVVNVDMDMDQDLPCNGKALYFGSQKFEKTDNYNHDFPTYTSGEDAIFVNSDGEWVVQEGSSDPIAYTAICQPVLDNVVITTDCDYYDEYFFEMEAEIAQLEIDLQVCEANGGNNNCSDELRVPIFVDGEWWYCDELIQSDCTDSSHGDAVQAHCPGTCGTCEAAAEAAVCGEKYHTKVFIPNIGSLYCDQLYPEECEEPGVGETCCATCP